VAGLQSQAEADEHHRQDRGGDDPRERREQPRLDGHDQ
jgi:hypothetical protein